jgi:hypothetical protein
LVSGSGFALFVQDTALNYSSTSLWGNWLEVLEAAMAKLLVKAVPAQHFAEQLVATALQPRMPRYWVGPCAGVEWLLRFFPLWLQVGFFKTCRGICGPYMAWKHTATSCYYLGLRHSKTARLVY